MLPDAPDLTAHRNLVAMVLAQHLEVPLSSGDPPLGDTHHLWREPERAQMEVQQGFEVEARDVIDCIVQHVLRLASRTDWFSSDRERRTLATEEIIIYNALGWSVSSEEAQEAFRDLWRAEHAPRSDPALLEADSLGDWLSAYATRLPESEERERTWLNAWDRWVRQS
jgi:hypothetical protein